MLRCPFCENTFLIEENQKNKQYYQCSVSDTSGCGGFFVHPDFFNTVQEQKDRYLLHTNELVSEIKSNGYRRYLEKYLSTVLGYESKTERGGNIQALFDYGSGPYPAFVMLLREYNEKKVFKNDVQIKHWDPFFYPNGDFFENGADIVFCLEVIEHFENPLEGFEGLAKSCAQGGLIAIQTQLAPNTFDDFKKWWYKDDFTHVSFYTHASIEACSKRVGLVLEAEKDGVVFLRKH